LSELIVPDSNFAEKIASNEHLSNLAWKTIVNIEAAQSKNTKRAYKSDWSHFQQWCEKFSFDSLPALEQIVAMYITAMSDTHKTSTISRRLVVIRQKHINHKHPSPTDSQIVKRAWQGILAQKSRVQKGKDPILTDSLVRMLEKIPSGIKGLRDKAILLTGFAGAFRRSELVGIKVEHLTFERRVLFIEIPKSKTDQEGMGQRIAIKIGNNEDTCAVTALEKWLHKSQIKEGVIFRPITKSDRVLDRPMNPRSIAIMVKKYAKQSNLGLDVSAHSLRAGFATQAAINGSDDRAIMKTTRHKRRETLDKYVRDRDLLRDNASGNLGL
jgi:site-specific recombinase XerD